MTLPQTIISSDLTNGCNETTMRLDGIDDLWMTLSLMKKVDIWTDADVEILFNYTDGYKITLKQTLVAQVAGGSKSGVCISVTPAINGMYCTYAQATALVAG